MTPRRLLLLAAGCEALGAWHRAAAGEWLSAAVCALTAAWLVWLSTLARRHDG